MKKIFLSLVCLATLISSCREKHPEQQIDPYKPDNYAEVMRITGILGDSILLKNNSQRPINLSKLYYANSDTFEVNELRQVYTPSGNEEKVVYPGQQSGFRSILRVNFRKDTLYLYTLDSLFQKQLQDKALPMSFSNTL